MEYEVRKKIRYDVVEAINYVMAPGSDSELSELEDEEEDEKVVEDETIIEMIVKQKEHYENFEAECIETTDEDQIPFKILEKTVQEVNADKAKDSVEDNCIDREGNECDVKSNDAKRRAKKSHVFRWGNRKPPAVDSTFSGGVFSLPPDNFDELTPLWYFKEFWDDEMTDNLCEQTNLYSVQKSGKSICTTTDEIEQLLGIQIRMALVKMPRYANYWQAETRYAPVADVMSKNRYKKLRQFLHGNDNTFKNDPVNKDNILYKVSPILDKLRENCQKIEQEEHQSIDEQIVPTKTKYSGMRQYNPRKPHKWGFKNFVRAGKSGMIYDFFFYTGGKCTGAEKCSAKSIVMKLCDNVPKGSNFKIFFDNWFSTLDLCLELKDLDILSAATIRENRLAGCKLKTEKELKKEGRGSFCFQTDQNSALTVIRWYDNKCVQLVSTYLGVEAAETVKRWDQKSKTQIQVQCPNVVKEYNKSMGGVDLADMLIALYRCKVKTKRWPVLLIFHAIDIAKVNAWLLYRRYCNQLGISRAKQISLLEFVSKLADALIKANKPPTRRSVGRPSKRPASIDFQETPKRRRAPKTGLPDQDSRFDGVGHWPEHRERKNKCRSCKVGFSRVYCEKCQLCLCLTSRKNCFRDFHHK